MTESTDSTIALYLFFRFSCNKGPRDFKTLAFPTHRRSQVFVAPDGQQLVGDRFGMPLQPETAVVELPLHDVNVIPQV